MKLLTLPIFSLAILMSTLFSINASAEDEQNCKIDTSKLLWTKAEYALTGDTLVINKQRVRLIGIHAPKIAKEQKFNASGEPLAKESQTFLNKLLANNDLEVGVEFDTTRLDNRNRQLVHLFLKDGTSVQQKMLESGFAVNRTMYNNLKHAKCYYQAEEKARKGGYQLWDYLAKHPEDHFPVVESSKLTTQDTGFRIIKGKVVKVEKSSTNYIINMDTTGIRVPKDYWDQFDYNKIKALKGQTIEVRGYAYLYKRVMYMIIKTPYAFAPLSPIGDSSP
ncbi:thermonuclease family protein [Thiomicrorhabdus sp. Milos-T2]|uniref:thermonuclease family protein n=1 Tax=Thiomicrorhabdus sp. Milos-T2 TaxID=90814 RepID=UPI000493FA48|nr:thermonuclease family protein [Thiomicrorhabdus sp. Milos-T2]